VNLPPSTRSAITQAAEPLRAAAPGLAWIDEARLHLTVKFLGEQPPSAVPALVEGLNRVASRHRSFALDLKGIGAFPNFRRARVVWMGVELEPRLELVHHDVESHCERLGHEVEGRPFRPHLTLARVKGRADESTLRALARAARAVSFETEVHVTTIDLMRSTLDARGARYDLVHPATLGAPVAREG